MSGTPDPVSVELREQHLTYRYRLLPTKGQHRRLRAALEHSRQLYNAALEERIDAYRKTGKGRSYYQQCAALTELRRDGSAYGVSMERGPLKAVDRAYKTFFARGGFPRFKSRDRFKSITWADGACWSVCATRFEAKGIGSVKIHMHRSLPSTPIAVSIRCDGKNWYICLVVNQDCCAANDNPAIGIDVGIDKLAALSDGTMLANLRAGSRAVARLRRLKRALARTKQASANRRKSRAALGVATTKIARQRSTYLHQVSAEIASRYGLIAVEKLRISNMVRSAKGSLADPGTNVPQKAGLNRSIHDASWGRLKELLRYKCALNGGQLVEVDPKGTSQLCSGCGVSVPKQLSQRWHNCPDCGLSIDRDTNAALNVLHRAVHGPSVGNVAGYGERSRGKAAA